MRLPIVASPKNWVLNYTAAKTSEFPYSLKNDSPIFARNKVLLFVWNWHVYCWFQNRLPLSLTFSQLNSLYTLFPVSSTPFRNGFIMLLCFAGSFTSTSPPASAWDPKVMAYNLYVKVIQAGKTLKGVSQQNCRNVFASTTSTLGLWLTRNKWQLQAAQRPWKCKMTGDAM